MDTPGDRGIRLLYWTVHFPTQFAWVQEMFPPTRFRVLNSVLEIQSQTASMLSGGLASLLLGKVPVALILTLDAASYVIGGAMIACISSRSSSRLGSNRTVTWVADMMEGFACLRTDPRRISFFLCALFPFIAVMAGNYVNPIFVVQTLRAEPSVLGLSSLLYAVGAVLAGWTVSRLMERKGAVWVIVACVALFAAGLASVAWFPVVLIFLVAETVMGWGNAGARIARNTLLMETVPNKVMGRVNSFFMGAGYVCRLLLLGSFTWLVPGYGAGLAYQLLAVLLALALAGVWLTRKAFARSNRAHQYMAG
ncbi:hypothetical protein GCM10011571_27270 [Marinithermofilum abyssi]|uniref:MFS transporter n=1 Tax=Marinithermofilum abyssi TaxID=1571185 RepID=A0A8J2VD80_9BACL|nr:MFS transporter [Marinithermofilum abyssi]GGE23765.1 hypothetical protein GCM10011571_27270 [Marinithermofilum abyssi]